MTNNKKFNWRNILTLTIGLIAYIYLFFILTQKINFSDFLTLFQLKNNVWMTILIISFLMMVSGQGLFLKSIFKIFDLNLSFKNALMTWLITVPTGLITFGLSGAAIIFYQAKKKEASTQLSTILTASYFILYVFANLLFMLVLGGSFFLKQVEAGQNNFWWISLLALIFISLLLTKRVRQFIVEFCGKKWPKIVDQNDKEKILNLKPTLILISIIYAILVVGINFLLFVSTCKIVQNDLSIFIAARSFIVSGVVAIFSPSGGGMGFVELATAGYLQISGVSSGQAGLIVLFYRFFNFWIPVILGFILLPLKGFKTLKKI